MTGFEPRTSGVGSDRSTNSATTTAPPHNIFIWNVFIDQNNLYTVLNKPYKCKKYIIKKHI